LSDKRMTSDRLQLLPVGDIHLTCEDDLVISVNPVKDTCWPSNCPRNVGNERIDAGIWVEDLVPVETKGCWVLTSVVPLIVEFDSGIIVLGTVVHIESQSIPLLKTRSRDIQHWSMVCCQPVGRNKA